MSTPQINWRLTLPILGSLIVHGCLILSVAIFAPSAPQKGGVYRVSLYKAGVLGGSASKTVISSKTGGQPQDNGSNQRHRLCERQRSNPCIPQIAKTGLLPAATLAVAMTETPHGDAPVADLSEPAEPAEIVKAGFTRRAVEHGIEGDVVFDLTVGPDGHVQDAEIIKRLGYGLDENARAAILQSTFVAAKDSHGHATIGRVIYKYKFRIENL